VLEHQDNCVLYIYLSSYVSIVVVFWNIMQCILVAMC
jgi:hypothetical protein